MQSTSPERIPWSSGAGWHHIHWQPPQLLVGHHFTSVLGDLLSGGESTCQCKMQLDPCPRLGISWKKKQVTTPVYLNGKSHGERDPVPFSPWSCKELATKWLVTKQQQQSFKFISKHFIFNLQNVYWY